MKEHDVSFLLLLLNNFPQLSRIKIPQRFEAWALKQFWRGGGCSILFLLILFIVLDLNKFNLYLDPEGEFVYILLIELKTKPS